MISTTLTVNDDGILQLPDAMLEELGWNEGDVLEWIEGSYRRCGTGGKE